jgi:feruloyl-CoA synthase
LRCRRLAAAQVLAAPAVRAAFQALMDRLWRRRHRQRHAPGGALLMAEPPSIDLGEVTDKGSINQRAVLAHRTAEVERLYAETPDADVIVPRS